MKKIFNAAIPVKDAFRYQRASDEKARIEDHVQSLAEKVKEKESKSRTNEILQKNREDEMKKHLDR